MKKTKGITLVSLVITVIVLAILASIATYSGISIIKSSKLTAFTTELKIMQTQINSIYQDKKDKSNYGTPIEDNNEVKQQAEKVFTEEESGITNKDGYTYWEKDYIKEELKIEGVEQDFFVNLDKRSVVSYEGLEYEGETYYTLSQLPRGLYNVEYEPLDGQPTFDVKVEEIGKEKWRVSILNIQYNKYIDKWQVRYKMNNKDYWNTTEDMSFVVNQQGTYNIQIENGSIQSQEVTKEIPENRPEKDIFVYLNGNTLYFTDDENTAKTNADSESHYYGNIKGRKYERIKYGTTNTPWFGDRASIQYVEIQAEIEPIYMDNYFYFLKQLKTIKGIENLKTDRVTSMYGLFCGCTNLESADVSGFDTSKVTNMNAMFANCSKLTKIDLSNFDTSNVTDMNSMFQGCQAIENLNVATLDTSNVTNMGYMFQDIPVRELNVSNFRTDKVTEMNNMFAKCKNLTTLDLSNFNTKEVTKMQDMFVECMQLTTLNVSNFNTSKVTNMQRMFNNCNALETLNLSSFDTSNVTDMQTMFHSCYNLTTLDISSFDTSQVTNMNSMFINCEKLTSLDMPQFNTANVSDMQYMFFGCTSLKSLNLLAFNTSKVTTFCMMFGGCKNLTQITVSTINWVIPSGADTTDMFSECGTNTVTKQ